MAKVDERYLDGSYESDNPDWHESDAGWKADLALETMRRNRLRPASICDVGCGTGGVLRAMSEAPEFPPRAVGFDVSQHIVDMARARNDSGIEFSVWSDRDGSAVFDLALVLDVVEHVPDYLGFMEELKGLAHNFIFHIPLDMNAQGVARQNPVLFARESVGHLHYFSRRTAVASLEYAGFDVMDWKFTPSWRRDSRTSAGRQAFNRLRSAAFRLSPEKCVDILGGYSLMVLARGAGSEASGSSGGSSP